MVKMEIVNRKAKYNYQIFDTIEAGIVLTGTEIKSLRLGKANIKDSYVRVKNNEMYIINMHISSYENGNIFNHDETRERKLLLHKKEIFKFRQTGVLPNGDVDGEFLLHKYVPKVYNRIKAKGIDDLKDIFGK